MSSVATETAIPAAFRPLCIFAAGRQQFDVMVLEDFADADALITAVFDSLPLEESGWNVAFAVARPTATEGVWRISRGIKSKAATRTRAAVPLEAGQ